MEPEACKILTASHLTFSFYPSFLSSSLNPSPMGLRVLVSGRILFEACACQPATTQLSNH